MTVSFVSGLRGLTAPTMPRYGSPRMTSSSGTGTFFVKTAPCRNANVSASEIAITRHGNGANQRRSASAISSAGMTMPRNVMRAECKSV